MCLAVLLVLAQTFAKPAQRCAECHDNIYKQWRDSAHARAQSTALYKVMRTQSGDSKCDGCHAPLASAVAADGVSCDACHLLSQVEPRREGAILSFHTQDDTRFGPLCDAQSSDAHQMGCSKLHSEARFCAACHLWYQGDLPVFTEYEEWQQSAEKDGADCQSCHMPHSKAEAAKGSGKKRRVPDHGLMLPARDLRQRALTLSVRVFDAGEALGVDLGVLNDTAGHNVPSGLPEHRIVVSARSISKSGQEQDRKQQTFGRVLVDASGKEAPFFKATRVKEDTRLKPGERRQLQWQLKAQGAGRVEIEVRWKDVAEAIDLPHGKEQVLLSTTVSYGAVKNGTRAQLPRTVEISK